MSSCTILILTYKGKHHLEYLLPTVKDSINNYSGELKVTVLIIDNGKDEDTRAFVQSKYPEYIFKFSPVNDYLFSLNDFIKEIDSEYTLLLNDDLKLDKNILNVLIPCIKTDEDVFAISCRIQEWDNKYTVSSVRMAKYSRGWMYNFYLGEKEDRIKYILYPSGGASIFRTSVFNELRGFDNLYRPAYCEDSDLGIRAWQNNWKILYHPDAIVYHREGGTMKDYYKENALDQLILRNNILWNYKNVRYPGFIFWFLLLYPYRTIRSLFTNKNHFRALLQAIPLLSKAYKRRKETKVIVDDKIWLEKLNQVYSKG